MFKINVFLLWHVYRLETKKIIAQDYKIREWPSSAGSPSARSKIKCHCYRQEMSARELVVMGASLCRLRLLCRKVAPINRSVQTLKPTDAHEPL